MPQTAEPQSTTPRRHWFVENVVPVLGSLTFHAALLVFGFLAYQSVRTFFAKHQEQTYIPTSSLIASDLSAIPDSSFRGPADRPDIRPVQPNDPDPTAHDWSQHPGRNRESMADSLASGAGEEAPVEQIIGVGPGSRGTNRLGTGPEGGPLAPFGPIAQAGGSPNIFSRTGSARGVRSVVFLCDASGSMLPKFATLKTELVKAIQGLAPSQSFSVVFFNEGPAHVFSRELLVANPENKLHADNFLEDVTPRGTTDPLPGLDAAFREKPELVYLLTDGDFPDNDAVLARIRQLNHDKRVKINTIAFVGEADTDTAFMALLKKIADENGGVYRYVRQDELN